MAEAEKPRVDPAQRCHGQVGLRAAHQAFVLYLLGYERVRNYDASMLEWANRADTPLVMED